MSEVWTNIIHPWFNFCPGGPLCWTTPLRSLIRSSQVTTTCVFWAHQLLFKSRPPFVSNQQMVKLLTCNYKQITLNFTLCTDHEYSLKGTGEQLVSDVKICRPDVVPIWLQDTGWCLYDLYYHLGKPLILSKTPQITTVHFLLNDQYW